MIEHPITERTESARDEKGGGWSMGYWVLGLLLLVYPLSVGPVAKLAKANVIPNTVAGPIYAPLEFLYEHSQPVKRFYDWYLELWGV